MAGMTKRSILGNAGQQHDSPWSILVYITSISSVIESGLPLQEDLVDVPDRCSLV